MTIRWQPKRPTEKRTYYHDWTPFLGTDTIASKVDVAAGVTLNSAVLATGNRAVNFTVSAGVAGALASITQTITTTAGLIESETFLLPIAVVEEPISLEEAKAHLRVTDDSEDALIELYVRAAREWVENYTGHTLLARTFTQRFNAWGDYLTLYHHPVTTVPTIEYDSADDDQAAFTDYAFSLGQRPMRIYPTSSFPSLRSNGYITVTYTAGYAEGTVPDALIQAVLLTIGHWHTTRASVSEDAMQEVPLAVRSLCAAYRGLVMA